jgi:hypothetical protein
MPSSLIERFARDDRRPSEEVDTESHSGGGRWGEETELESQQTVESHGNGRMGMNEELRYLFDLNEAWT